LIVDLNLLRTGNAFRATCYFLFKSNFLYYTYLLAELITEIERKFKSLRTSFQVELKKIPAWRSGQGAEDISTLDSSWLHFSAMLFLKDTIGLASNTNTKSNLEIGSASAPVSKEIDSVLVITHAYLFIFMYLLFCIYVI
jgi:hypothetical protein